MGSQIRKFVPLLAIWAPIGLFVWWWDSTSLTEQLDSLLAAKPDMGIILKGVKVVTVAIVLAASVFLAWRALKKEKCL